MKKDAEGVIRASWKHHPGAWYFTVLFFTEIGHIKSEVILPLLASEEFPRAKQLIISFDVAFIHVNTRRKGTAPHAW